jgi:hypothetical protein
MKAHFALTLMILALLAAGAAPVQAGFEAVISQTITIDTGTSIGTVTMPFTGVIREAYLDCPLLDSGDTATVSLTLTPITDSAMDTIAIVPNGWTDILIGNTSDNAVNKLFASRGTIDCQGLLTWQVQTSSNQIADRTFRILVIREY